MTKPIRTCIGCRQKSTKWEIIRLVRNQSGQVSVDKTGKSPGRGAYVCLNSHCIKSALAPKRLNKALRANLDTKAIEPLRQALLELLEIS